MLFIVILTLLFQHYLFCSTGQYYENSSSSCQSCSSNCVSCLNAQACSLCSSNYYISNNRCQACLTDIGCRCNGSSMSCSTTFKQDQLFLILAISIGALFVISIIICIVKINCFPEPEPAVPEQSFEDYFQRERTEIDNLGILVAIMKNSWTSNLEENLDANEICAICLGDDCDLQTQCHHAYHLKCLIEWTKRKRSCPMCKRQNMQQLKKFCKRCRKNNIQADINKLEKYTLDFFRVCLLCKNKSTKRLDSLCEMEVNEL